MAVIISKRIVVPTPGKRASDYVVGDTVKLIESGAEVEYLVVHQGNPDLTMYDKSCNGTWLWRKFVLENSSWDDNRTSKWDVSSVKTRLNTDVFNHLSEESKNSVLSVKIPYFTGGNIDGGGPINSLERGSSVKLFLLSFNEMGMSIENNSNILLDGHKLDYFLPGLSSSAWEKRKHILNGEEVYAWSRSVHKAYTNQVWILKTGNVIGNAVTNNAFGVKYAMIINSKTLFDPDTNTIKG